VTGAIVETVILMTGRSAERMIVRMDLKTTVAKGVKEEEAVEDVVTAMIEGLVPTTGIIQVPTVQKMRQLMPSLLSRRIITRKLIPQKSTTRSVLARMMPAMPPLPRRLM